MTLESFPGSNPISVVAADGDALPAACSDFVGRIPDRARHLIGGVVSMNAAPSDVDGGARVASCERDAAACTATCARNDCDGVSKG